MLRVQGRQGKQWIWEVMNRKKGRKKACRVYIEENNTATQAKIMISFQCQNERNFYKKDI